jgi:uncharacterized protein YcbK (DUF882 family)
MKLTKNFNKVEFDSKDGAEMPAEVLKNIKILARHLQTIRNYVDEPINVNSAYRSEKHNKAIGGVKNSYHVKGLAVDITIKSKTPKQVYKILNTLIDLGCIPNGGIGLYNGFVHFDIRGYKARWDNSSLFNF